MEKKDGINVENITFDANGEVAGLDDTTLDTIAAGAGIATTPDADDDIEINFYCPRKAAQ